MLSERSERPKPQFPRLTKSEWDIAAHANVSKANVNEQSEWQKPQLPRLMRPAGTTVDITVTSQD
jgi:hypothetical protein